MKRLERPRIGITMRLELETNRFYLARYYSEAVEAAGGLPVHVALIPNPEYIAGVMAGIDGLLLPGSDSDIDPLRYGQEPYPRLGSVHPEKDATDLLALEEAERRATPIFAICFGIQSLNVFRGGTLIQDIPSQQPKAIKHNQGAPRDRHSHRVRILDGSLLRQLAASETAAVNSHHHQAIENLGRELVATFVNPKHDTAMAVECTLAGANAAEATAMGKSAHERVRDNFLADRDLGQWMELLGRLGIGA